MSIRKSSTIAFAFIVAMVFFGQAVQPFLFAGSGDASAPSPEKETARELTSPSDTFVMASLGEPYSLDPALDYENAGAEILQNVYETLVWYHQESTTNLDPLLATAVPSVANGGITPDGMNYTFRIRSGVTFHDGSLLTPADVLFSIQRICTFDDPTTPGWMVEQVLDMNFGYYYFLGSDLGTWISENSPPAYLTAGLPADPFHIINVDDVNLVVANAVTINGDNVTIRLTHPYSAFLQICAYTVMDIVSSSYVIANGNASMSSTTCGTGPYKLESWVVGTSLNLVRNDNYWKTPASIPKVTLLDVGNAIDRINMLKAGDADSAYVSISDESQFTGPNFHIVKGLPTFNVEFFCFIQYINISDLRGRYGNAIVENVPYTISGGFNYSTFFADLHVRKAFAAALDYETFINSASYGNAEQLSGPIPKGMFGYNATVPKMVFNLTFVRDQLENYTTDYLTNGFTIPIFYNAGNLYREAACNMLSVALESISPNIHIIIIGSSWSVMIPMMNTRPCAMPGFTIGWAPDYADADDYVLPFLHSTRGIYPYAMSYANASMDALIDQAAAEIDTAQRLIDYYDISMGAYHDQPIIWLTQGKNFHVERSWVNGYYFNPMYGGLYFYALSKSAAADSTPPDTVADIVGTLGSNGWYRSDVIVNLTATDDISGVNWTRYEINGAGWINYTGDWMISTEGSFVLKYYSEDMAGNEEANTTVTIKIDKTAPALAPSTSGIAGSNGWLDSDATVTLAPSDSTSGIDHTKYRIDGGTWLSYTVPISVDSDGTHTVDYFSTDLAGNNGTGSSIVKIDRVAPVLTINQSSGTIVDKDYFLLGWEGSDASSGIDHFEVKLDGSSYASVGTATSHNLTGLTEGLHNVTVKAFDKAGHQFSTSIQFTVRSTAAGGGISGDFVTYGLIIVVIAAVLIALMLLLRRRKEP